MRSRGNFMNYVTPYKNPNLMGLMKPASTYKPIMPGLGSTNSSMQSYNQGLSLGKGGTSMLGTTDAALNNNLSIMDSLKGYGKEAMSYMPSIGGKDSMFTMEKAFGENGYAAPVMQGLGALASGWSALKSYGVAKDTLNFEKEAFAKNYAAQMASMQAGLANRYEHNRNNASPAQQAAMGTADEYVAKYRKPQ